MQPCSQAHRPPSRPYSQPPAPRQSAEHSALRPHPTAKTPEPPLLPSLTPLAPYLMPYTPEPQRTVQTPPAAESYLCPSKSPPSHPPASTQSGPAQNHPCGSLDFHANSESGSQTGPPADYPAAVSPFP